MANTKISALTTGTPAVGTDEFPIARAGANNKLTLAQLVTLASTSPSFTGVSTFANGSAANPSITFTGQNTTGLWLVGAGQLGIAIGGSDIYRFSNTSMSLQSNSGGVFLGASGDAAILRAAAGVLAITNISSANSATGRRYGGNAGYVDWGSVSENLTLNTGGTTTDTAADLLPANSYIDAVTARVTTTVATATSWQLGDPTTAGRFTAAQSGGQLTAGATVVGLVQCDQSGAAGPRQTAAAKVRVTTVGTPSAGAIRITSYYNTFVPATS